MPYVGAAPALPPPGALTAITLVASPDGGAQHLWANPKAVYDATSDKTFFGFVRDNGQVCVAEFNNASPGAATVTVVATTEGDLHAAPALILREDRRLIVVYGKHNVAFMRSRISTNVADSTAWGTEINLASTLNGNNLTYPTLIRLSGDASGTIHLFFRNFNGTNWSWRESVSTNHGASWPAASQIYSSATAQAYCFFTDNGVDTIHFVATDRSPILGTTTKMAHMYRTAGTYYQSDGTTISPAFGNPIFSEMTEMWDGTGGVPEETDFCLDGSGDPYIVHMDGMSAVDWRYTLSFWDGAAWADRQLATGYSSIPNNGNAGGVAINRADITQLYVSAQQPGGRYEMELWDNADAWATSAVTKTAITSGSSVDQVFPTAVRSAASELVALWLSGTWDNTTYDAWTLGITGAGS